MKKTILKVMMEEIIVMTAIVILLDQNMSEDHHLEVIQLVINVGKNRKEILIY